MKFSQKGAMFGLDARIALAIFGALSVITGAALYSAIKDSKIVAIVTELDNVGKAVTSFYIDTGVFPAANTTTIFLEAGDLITDPTVAGWNGPYISFEDSSNAGNLAHTIYTDIALVALIDGTNAPVVATEAGKCLNASATCSLYTCINGIADDFKVALDLKIDGTAGATAGSFKYTAGTAEFGCMKALSFDPASAAE